MMSRQSATYQLAWLVTLVALGCAENELSESSTQQVASEPNRPTATGSIDDLFTDAAPSPVESSPKGSPP